MREESLRARAGASRRPVLGRFAQPARGKRPTIRREAQGTLAQIPKALQLLASWVRFKLMPRPDGKFKKAPCGPDGKTIDGTDPANWIDFDAARTGTAGDGAGLMLDGLGGIDLDGVLDQETGRLDPIAQAVLNQFPGCYVEVSPSGTGLHVPAKLEPGARVNIQAAWTDDGQSRKIEVFAGPKQFLTMTGRRWRGCGDAISTDVRQFEELVADLGVLKEALKDARLRRLWIGDRDPAHYPTDSHADLGLLGILKRRGADRAMGRRLWLISKLAFKLPRKGAQREKYIERTLDTAFGSEANAKEQKASAVNGTGVDRVIFESFDSIEAKPVHWIKPNFVARRELTLLCGDGGDGKTTIALEVAAHLSNRRIARWWDGTLLLNHGDVLIWSPEDTDETTIKPRLAVAASGKGADMKRIHRLRVEQAAGGQRTFDLSKDLPILDHTIHAMKEPPQLIVIGSIMSGVRGDSNLATNIRPLLEALKHRAGLWNCGIFAIGHYVKNKAGRSGTALSLGSAEFGNVPAIVLGTFKKENGERVITRLKSRLGPEGGGFRYQIEAVPNTVVDDVKTEPVRVAWGGEYEGSKEQAQREFGQIEGSSKTYIEQAKELLLVRLQDGDWQPAKELEDEAATMQINKKCLQRALNLIGGESQKMKGKRTGWEWRLPAGSEK